MKGPSSTILPCAWVTKLQRCKNARSLFPQNWPWSEAHQVPQLPIFELGAFRIGGFCALGARRGCSQMSGSPNLKPREGKAPETEPSPACARKRFSNHAQGPMIFPVVHESRLADHASPKVKMARCRNKRPPCFQSTIDCVPIVHHGSRCRLNSLESKARPSSAPRLLPRQCHPCAKSDAKHSQQVSPMP